MGAPATPTVLSPPVAGPCRCSEELAAELGRDLEELGARRGLAVVGFASAEPFDATRVDLVRRRDQGLHGGMAFTYRNPDRSTDPQRILAGARTLVVGALAYRAPADPPQRAGSPGRDGVPTRAATVSEPGPRGRVARYVWSDAYARLRTVLGDLATTLGAAGWRARVVCDDNALVDREAAWRAGLGWYGKSSLLLHGDLGSWFVIGSVVTDAPLPVNKRALPDGCGPCARCAPACPTGAIVEPGVVDARRCLAWLLQAPGSFPREHRVALGDRIYGCDACQEVCPVNKRTARRAAGGGAKVTGPATPATPATPADTEGSASKRVSPEWGVDAEMRDVDLLWMLGASDPDLMARLGRWYVPGRQARYLRRNALIALGNAGDGADDRTIAVLRRCLDDADPLIRGHAVWAAARLDRRDLVEERAESESDPAVQEEMAAVLGGEVATR